MKTSITIFIIFLVFLISGCTKEAKEASIEKDDSYYVACGCGCCGGQEPVNKCLYKSKGDDLNKIIESDKNASASSQCAVMGCSIGVKYVYCD